MVSAAPVAWALAKTFHAAATKNPARACPLLFNKQYINHQCFMDTYVSFCCVTSGLTGGQQTNTGVRLTPCGITDIPQQLSLFLFAHRSNSTVENDTISWHISFHSGLTALCRMTPSTAAKSFLAMHTQDTVVLCGGPPYCNKAHMSTCPHLQHRHRLFDVALITWLAKLSATRGSYRPTT